MEEIVPVIADLYHDDFPEVAEKREEVVAVLVKEEKAFRQTLRKGIKEFDRLFAPLLTESSETASRRDSVEHASAESRAADVSENSSAPSFDIGAVLFTLYDTYGFPLELSVEEAFKRGIKLPNNWRQEFDEKMARTTSTITNCGKRHIQRWPWRTDVTAQEISHRYTLDVPSTS